MENVTVTLYVLYYYFPIFTSHLEDISKPDFNLWEHKWDTVENSISRNHKENFIAVNIPHDLYVNFNNSFIRNKGEYSK